MPDSFSNLPVQWSLCRWWTQTYCRHPLAGKAKSERVCLTQCEDCQIQRKHSPRAELICRGKEANPYRCEGGFLRCDQRVFHKSAVYFWKLTYFGVSFPAHDQFPLSHAHFMMTLILLTTDLHLSISGTG